MTTIYQIRGTNGSGKTTVARAFLAPDYQTQTPVDLSSYPSPTKKDPSRVLRYPGYGHDGVLVLGKYDDGCGGMDRHPAGKGFAVPIDAINYALRNPIFESVHSIICEGVLASGVFGSWSDFAQGLPKEDQFVFVYMWTPLDVCLERIQQRRVEAGAEPKTGPDWDRMVKNVADKFTGTAATRAKAIAAGHMVYDLPVGHEVEAMKDLVAFGAGSTVVEAYRARP